MAWPVWTCRRRGGRDPRRRRRSGRGGVRVAATSRKRSRLSGSVRRIRIRTRISSAPTGTCSAVIRSSLRPTTPRRLSRDAGCVSSTFDHRVMRRSAEHRDLKNSFRPGLTPTYCRSSPSTSPAPGGLRLQIRRCAIERGALSRLRGPVPRQGGDDPGPPEGLRGLDRHASAGPRRRLRRGVVPRPAPRSRGGRDWNRHRCADGRALPRKGPRERDRRRRRTSTWGALAPASLGVVFSAQVIEHLERSARAVPQTVALAARPGRALRRGDRQPALARRVEELLARPHPSASDLSGGRAGAWTDRRLRGGLRVLSERDRDAALDSYKAGDYALVATAPNQSDG